MYKNWKSSWAPPRYPGLFCWIAVQRENSQLAFRSSNAELIASLLVLSYEQHRIPPCPSSIIHQNNDSPFNSSEEQACWISEVAEEVTFADEYADGSH